VRRVPDGVEISWRTASHRDLLAWGVVREPGPGSATLSVTLDLVPTTESSDEGMSYFLLDRAPGAPGASYRLYALTSAGVRAEQERCTVEAPPAE